MARRTQTIDSPVRVVLNLNDPAMTRSHCAGVAGLWMSLKQLEMNYPDASQRPGHLDWLLTSDSIELTWQLGELGALDWLFRQAFAVDQDGLISLVGLAPITQTFRSRFNVHNGIISSFLQHNQSRKLGEAVSHPISTDLPDRIIQYCKVTSYAHQDFANHLCDKRGQLRKRPICIAGWLYPGATVRHVRFRTQTSFSESALSALALLFAPVACQYFRVAPSILSTASGVAVVVPQVNDLEVFSAGIWSTGELTLEHNRAANLEDAALRFLNASQEHGGQSCEASLFGVAAWSPRQKVRTHIATLTATAEMLENYSLAYQLFCDRRITYLLLGIIASSLGSGQTWWTGFSADVDNPLVFDQLSNQEEGLRAMIEGSHWDNHTKQLYVQVCHKALKVMYAKIYERTPGDQYPQIERFNQRTFIKLRRCKTSEMFREFVASFFGETRPLDISRETWESLLLMMTDSEQWKMTKSLTLLALASYPRNPERSESTDQNSPGEPEQSTEVTDIVH